MRTELTEIHKEHFEHWLNNQHDGREWQFTDCSHCLIASFLRDNTTATDVTVTPEEYALEIEGRDRWYPMPEWLLQFQAAYRCACAMRHKWSTGAKETLYADIVKATWRNLFPETEPTLTPPRKEQATV